MVLGVDEKAATPGATTRFTDPALPAVGALLGAEAPAILEAGIGSPLSEVRPTQVRYDPGRSVTVSYAAHDADGRLATICAYAGRQKPDGAAIVSDGANEVAVWRYPHDPMLPGLRHAVEPRLLAGLLEEVGAGGVIRMIRTRTYRPRRRAVVEVMTDDHRLFIKVVRPHKVSHLHTLHAEAARHLRVPRNLGWSPDLGVAILEALPGTSVRHAVEDGRPRLPAPAVVTALLDRIPPIGDPRPGLLERLDTHRRLLAAIVPEVEDDIDEMIEHIRSAAPQPVVAAHNDFHAAQVMMADGEVTGLVDIDTLGPGTRADDYAMMLGHLYTLALGSSRPRAVAAYGARLLGSFETAVGANELRLRIAAAVIAFSSAPFRAQQPNWPERVHRRLDAAREWIRSAPVRSGAWVERVGQG